MRKAQIFLTLVVLSTFSSTFLLPPVQFQQVSKVAPTTIASVPNHLSRVSENNSNAPVDVNLYETSEPAPIGIADYGIGSSGAYKYNTSSFLATAKINSLTTSAPASTFGPNMTLQLNVVLAFSSQSGRNLVYWLQDVLFYDTSNHQGYFENNIWNLSSRNAEMSSSGVFGTGQVYNYSHGGHNDNYYGATVSSYSQISLPATVQFLINSTIGSQSQPRIYFQYNYGSGWQTFDVVTFPILTSQLLDSGLVVDGTRYNPSGTFYNSEFILGGAGNSSSTTLVASDIQLQLQFWNGHNYQEVTNAYNFGSNTAESISNAVSEGRYFSTNGSVYAQISPGSGSLGRLYTQSQMGIVTLLLPFSSGEVYVGNSTSFGSAYSFTGQSATLTLSPGSYTFYAYSKVGTEFGRLTATVVAGETRSYSVTSSSAIALILNYSIKGGGTAYSPPTITYVTNGFQKTVTLSSSPTIYYLDQGSSWFITSTLKGSTSDERWITNQTTSTGTTTSDTTDFVYYHQYLVTFNFSVVGGGTGYSTPTFVATQLGNNISSTAGHSIWVDAGSHYSYVNLLVGSTGSERWIGNSLVSGTITSSTTLDPIFTHQYYIRLQSRVQSGGTVSPSSGWVNAGSSLTVSSSATSGWKFEAWNGTGLGAYSGTANTTTITIMGPITESALFYPGLTIMIKGGGSITYSFGSTSSRVTSTETVYVPIGTTVGLKAAMLFFDKLDSWSGGVSGTDSQTDVTVQSPITVQAQFSLNFIIIGDIAAIFAVLIAVLGVVSRKRKNNDALIVS